MKLEDKFFHSFFYPFLIGVLLSMIIVTIFLTIFTNKYFDKRTGRNIVDLEKKYAEININSVISLLTTTLLKIQASLNEQILFYQKLANKAENISNYKINKFLKCVLDLDEKFLKENKENLKYMGFWFVDNNTTVDSLEYNSTINLQLITYSNIIQNVYSTLAATISSVPNYFFIFDKTDLFIDFPIEYDYSHGTLSIYTNYTDNPVWCADSKGDVFKFYKFKCREFYINFQKSKQGIFDANYIDQNHRTIYITNPYVQLGENETSTIFSMCIQFDDPISKGVGYACADIFQDDLIFSFDNFNSKLVGYFLITSIGLNKAFYFPQVDSSKKTPTENIFRWDRKFYLKEKTYFLNNVQKLITSNYYKYLNESGSFIFEEIKINGKNTSDQFFYINGEKFYFSLFPIVLENIKGIKEHILSIVYFYNNDLYYKRLDLYQSNTNIKIALEILLFTVFGSGLLYLVILSFNTLAKYIVIPIKNVNYMLKGIHIGGENRLEYLEFLKNRQEENLEKLQKLYYFNEEKKKKNELVEETNNQILKDNNIEDENNNKNNDINKEEANLKKNNDYFEEKNNNINNNLDYIGEIINPKEDYNKKFDKESNYIEKETNFYDFDEELLQYRPLEIDHLVKVLLDLKGALLLTSSDQKVKEIINYSYSEEIFHNFKNKDGAMICQSNIGNLQSQLLKFDKAIYHLALSLDDDKLKRFFSKTLSDEFDESDTLLHKILLCYNKENEKEKLNILAEKQQSNTRDKFSQKIIGLLINSRYCKLINVYFKFFSILQKSNVDNISGQFMNTYFHSINYYHKILIQYIYLCHVKNDLIKIGESILDYLEFLIKFKFKISSDNKFILNINNLEKSEYKDKQKYKKKIFNKIIKWFNLFDNYVSHVRDNSSLGDDKSIIEDYSHSISSTNNELNSGSQSVFLFKVNIQRGDFLKGKFALTCKNYNDALFFFIRAAKKRSIVLDGLIQKKSLKRILKISMKLSKQLETYGINNLSMNQKLLEYDKIKHRNINKKSNQNYIDKNNLNNEEGKQSEDKNTNSFEEEMEKIKKEIKNNINECNAKQSKDIIILIDYNLYENEYNNNNNSKTDSFIDQTSIILSNYLSNNDRLGVFIYTGQYQIICPLMCKIDIDIKNITRDLIYFKKKFYKENETDEFYINENDLQNEKIEFQSNNDNFSESRSQGDSFDEEDKRTIYLKIVSGLIKAINYTKNYLRMKESIKNEKYIILCTLLFNYFKITDKDLETKLKNMTRDKEINFLLAGKYKNEIINNEKEKFFDENEEKKLNEIITEKFGDKSKLIYYENMKEIKAILSNNTVIKDEVIYPNEIYKN